MEAAAIDGANAYQRFRDIVVPALKPIILILTSLSVLWDFRVFTQIYVLQSAGGITRDTNLLGVYAYRISIGANQFDKGAAIAVIMVLITVLDDDVLPALDDRGRRSCDGDARAADRSRSAPRRRGARNVVPNLLGTARLPDRRVPRLLDGADVVPPRRRHPAADTAVPAVPGHARTTTARSSTATSSGPR